MRLTFFRNEDHEHPRVTCLWTNAHPAEVRKFPEMLYNVILVVCNIFPLLLHFVFAWEFFLRIRQEHGIWVTLFFVLLFYTLMNTLLLFIHEFLHAIGAWICGKPVYAIRMFPYYQRFRDVLHPKRGWKTPGGYCCLDLCRMTKGQYLFYLLLPLLVLGILPLFSALLLSAMLPPEIRLILLMIGALGIAAAALDIPDSIKILAAVPRGAFYIHYNGWFYENDEPFLFDKIDTDGKVIRYERWQYHAGALVQLPTPEPDARVTAMFGEFRRQFGIEEPVE